MAEFRSDRYHLAGSVMRGIGHAWLATSYGLDDRWGQGPWHQAASTRAAAIRWIRDAFDEEAGGVRVPVRIHAANDRLSWVYVDRRHIEKGEDDQ